MDKSQNYINQCKKSSNIQQLKLNRGFEEGDFIYVEDENPRVHCVSADFIEVRQKFDSSSYPHRSHDMSIYFSSIEDEFSITTKPTEILVEQNEMKIRKFKGDQIIWLPRQDQLEAFYYKAIIKRVDSEEWLKSLLDFYNELGSKRIHYRSNESLALGMIYYAKYNLLWNGKEYSKS